jgi:phosphonate transport system substrate-binding protein
MAALKFVSLLAANADAHYCAIAEYLAYQTGVPITLFEHIPWQERELLLERGQIDLGAVCGAQYVRIAQQVANPVQLLAAPVMQAERYQGRPVYFSDLIVRADATFQSFAELRGATLAYNEPRSYSGYHVLRAHLAALGERIGYFRRTTEAGSHQAALRMVIAGAADVAAIDSIVLERELVIHPALASQIRIVDSLGPSPIPPLLAARRLPAPTIHALHDALLHMHHDAEGQRILRAGQLSYFVAVEDPTYEYIRTQLQRAGSIELAASYSQHL